MSVYVTFTEEKTVDTTSVYGPYDAVQLLINELWILDQAGEAVEALAEYDTHEGTWHLLHDSDGTRYNLVTIRSA